jgi:1,4-dihydroxy-2-naphthoyl-CoA hydrolase
LRWRLGVEPGGEWRGEDDGDFDYDNDNDNDNDNDKDKDNDNDSDGENGNDDDGGELGMTTTAFEHRFRVALHDTDAAGVMFFAHLFRHAHDAYEAWMAALGFPLDAMIADGVLRLPLVHAEADYRRPLRHGEAVLVQLGVAEVRERSFALDYAFLGADGELAASARTVHVAVDADGGQALPAALQAALRRTGGAITQGPGDADSLGVD